MVNGLNKEMLTRLKGAVDRINAYHAERYKEMTTGVIVKYVMILPKLDNEIFPTETRIDVSLHIEGWESLMVQHQRRALSGVDIIVSNPVSFVYDSANVLRLMFYGFNLSADVKLEMYQRERYLSGEKYKYELMECLKLDFVTYEEEDVRVKLEATTDNLHEYVKSIQKVKVDIPVKDVRYKYPLAYEHIKMLNVYNYTIYAAKLPAINQYINVHYSSSELIPESMPIHEHANQQQGKRGYFFKAVEADTVTVGLDLNLSTNIIMQSRVVSLVKKKDDMHIAQVKLWNFNENSLDLHVVDKVEVRLEKGEYLYFYVNSREGDRVLFDITSKEVSVKWYAKTNKPADIDVVDPEALLQKIINMSNPPRPYTAKIEWGRQLYKSVLCAAESIRDFSNATIHTSLDDFFKWMDVKGYEFSYESDSIVFRKRDEFYKRDVVALHLKRDEVSKLTVSANEDFAFTSLEIGYKKQDYNSINGRFELNGTFSYTTGFTRQEEKKLSLISPFRADSIGFEMLTWKRLEKRTDTESDNDLFEVATINAGDKLYLFLEPNDSGGIMLFNTVLCPHRLVVENESKLGIISNKLTFRGTDASRVSSIEGINLYGDIPIRKHLFSPVVYRFDAGQLSDLPDLAKRDGLIYVDYNQRTIKGYVKEISKNYHEEQKTEWELHALV